MSSRTPAQPESWRDLIKVHPAADLFPMMSDAELDELGKDIRENGMLHGVVLWTPDRKDYAAPKEVFPLDGRNRLAAIERAFSDQADRRNALSLALRGNIQVFDPKIAGPLQLYGTTEPYAYAISANIRRRHLSIKDKHVLIIKLLQEAPWRSDRAIAKTVQGSHPFVAKIRAEGERAGDVETVSTRTDAVGRQQPARKPPKPRTKPAEVPPALSAEYSAPLAEAKTSVPAPHIPESLKLANELLLLRRPADVAPAVGADDMTDDELTDLLIEKIGRERLLELAPEFFRQPWHDQNGPGTNPFGKLIDALGKLTSAPDIDDIPEKTRRALARSCLRALNLTIDNLRPKETRFERWSGLVEELGDIQSDMQDSLDNMPENFRAGEQAEKLEAYICIDLSALDPT